MDNSELVELYNTLETISSVGVDMLVVEPTDEGETKFRGIDDKQSIILYDTIPHKIVERGLGIYSLRVLLSRFKLFNDLNSLSFSFEPRIDNLWEKKLNLKSKDTKLSYTFSDNTTMSVPVKAPTIQEVARVKFNSESFTHFSSAVRSMRLSKSYNEKVSFSNKNGNVVLELNDGIADTFTKTVGTSNGSSNWSRFEWRTDSIEKLLKQALTFTDEVDMIISDKGVSLITVDNLTFMVAPE